jgi:hypothetical protein
MPWDTMNTLVAISWVVILSKSFGDVNAMEGALSQPMGTIPWFTRGNQPRAQLYRRFKVLIKNIS